MPLFAMKKRAKAGSLNALDSKQSSEKTTLVTVVSLQRTLEQNTSHSAFMLVFPPAIVTN